MGHKSGDTTEIYMHYAPAHDDADSIERAFAVVDPRAEITANDGQEVRP